MTEAKTDRTGINRSADRRDSKGTDTMRQESMFLVPDGVTTSVVFIVENRELYASKEVLALTSPVFRSMFESDFKERSAESIPLPGKAYSDVVEFLLCIYPNTLKDINDENVYGVLRLADEYQVELLRNKCIDFLRNKCHESDTPLTELVTILRMSDAYYLKELYNTSFNRVMKAHPMDLKVVPDYQQLSSDIRDEIMFKRSKALDDRKVSDDNVYEVLKDASEYQEQDLIKKCETHLVNRCKKSDKPLVHGLVTMLCAADRNKLTRLREAAMDLAIKRKSYDLEASPIFHNVALETRCRILSKRVKVFETLFGKLCKLRNHCCRKHSDYNCKICFISVTKESYATVGLSFG